MNSGVTGKVARSVIKKTCVHEDFYRIVSSFQETQLANLRIFIICLVYEMRTSFPTLSVHTGTENSEHGEDFRGNLGDWQMSEDRLE